MSDQIYMGKTKALKGIKNRAEAEATPIHSTIRLKPDGKQNYEKVEFPVIPVAAAGESTPSLFKLNQQLGKGGSGAVYRAQQTTLNRDVAIKSPHSMDPESRQVDLLLREAHIMAYLEHPGIVPIHLVARDDDQKPYVVMKRIEGQDLKERLKLQRHALENLEENLDVLTDVCHALSYAHSRGIIHRDIKPSNIMTGAFGEVYLLDWGTAVSFHGDVPDTIPRAEPDKVVGTPSYLAPEMVTMEQPHGPRTDVYLMGGLLYSILTGRAPHKAGESKWSIFLEAERSEPKTFPEDVPRPLADICNRAMSRDQKDRYASVDEFRQALQDVRDYHAAQELARRGIDKTAELRDMLAGGDPSDAEIYAIFGAAQQMLEESLRLWPQSDNARYALQGALAVIIEFELARDNPLGAQRYLEQLEQGSEQLAARVEKAVAEHRKSEQELRHLRHEMDPRVAGRTKAMLWFGIGLAVAVPQLLPVAMGIEPTAQSLAIGQGILIVVLAILCVTFRERLFSTRINRALTTSVWMPVIAGLLLRIGLLFDHGSIAYAMAIDLSFVGLVVLYIAVNMDRRVQFLVPGYFLGALATVAFPGNAVWIFPLTHLFNMFGLGIHHLLVAAE